MKIYKTPFLLSVTLAAFLYSCNNLLEVEAEDTISGDVLTNEENIHNALYGAYNNLAGVADGTDGGELVGGDFILIPTLLARIDNPINEIRWEFTTAPPSYQDFVNKDVLSTNGRVAANWRRAYETINVANNILANIENVENQQSRRKIQGEALAFRGIIYFEMIRLWAPHYRAAGVDPDTRRAIPIRTAPINDVNEIPELTTADLNTIEEVYDRAEQDLREAATALEPFGTNASFLSYYACHGYLSRLYLQKGEYGNALNSANIILTSGQFELEASPRDAFNNVANSNEDVFAIQQTLANNSGDRTNGIGLTAFYSSLAESGVGTMGVFRTALDFELLVNSPRFSSEDLRGTIDLTVDENTTSSQINTAFYRNLANNSDELLSSSKYMRADHVIPVIRLAEIYLTRAEAVFETLGAQFNTQAINDLNAVRTRAGLPALEATDFTDEFAFFDSLTLERNRELLHEGQLLHDLRRWRFFDGSGTYDIGLEGATGIDPWDESLILPIPQSELDAGDFN